LEAKQLLHGAGVLSGAVFLDLDGSGARGSFEPGLPGVMVQLSGNTTEGGSVSRSTMTDDNGNYAFEELEPGTYQIVQQQPPSTLDGTESTPISGGVSENDQLRNLVLADDQTQSGNNFAERSLRPEFVSIGWYFASAGSSTELLREAVAVGFERAGNTQLANLIRGGNTDVPDDATNTSPTATDDVFTVAEDAILNVAASTGVLANDSDLEGNPLTAALARQPNNGTLTLNGNGSFIYTPNANFHGVDSFTYRASDGANTSNLATVTINVTEVDEPNQLFGSVTPGSYEESGLMGIRTDLVSGAPPMTRQHVDGDIDYTGYSNPPTYGDHHGFDPDGTDVNPGITPRPTGVYTTEQPEEDLIHNLEHGHVWISYDPELISDEDLAALQKLVRDGSPNENGSGVGVILTPRAANDQTIVLASWARLLTLDSYNAETIRSFVETNRGKAPEGFITP
jgi:hypothetical protein